MTEIVRDLTAEEARELTSAIVHGMASIWELVAHAYLGRAWLALGYVTWDAYCDSELAGVRLALNERREMSAALQQAGMSTRAIGSATGVSQTQVRKDLELSTFSSPPERVQGRDGQSYPSTQPEPEDPWTAPELKMASAVRHGKIVVASYRGGAHARLLAWAEDADLLVRIDRRSEWGNPFETPADGDRDTVIKNFEEHYLPYKPSLLTKLADLRGKVLACWCAPLACHGDVLKAWAER